MVQAEQQSQGDRNTSEDYIHEKRLTELFCDLLAAACFHKPDNIREFVTKELQRRKDHGKAVGLFSDNEIQAVFRAADLSKNGVISPSKAREALKVIASSARQVQTITELDLGDREITFDEFKPHAQKVFDL